MFNKRFGFKWSWTGEFLIRVAMLGHINVNLKDTVGRTALMRATELGAYRLVKELLARNADVNIQDAYGYTALMIASVDGYSKIIKRLLAEGADIELLGHRGMGLARASQRNPPDRRAAAARSATTRYSASVRIQIWTMSFILPRT